MAAALHRLDCEKWWRGGLAERAAIADSFDRALRTDGVCFLTNFGRVLPDSAIQRVISASASFFSADAATKRRSFVDGVVGYLSVGAENVGASSGEPSALPDPVESLNLPGYQEEGRHWDVERMRCPWATAGWLPRTVPDFGSACVAYWAAVTRLMLMLMEVSEMALDLPSGFFSGPFFQPGTLLRLSSYPALGSELASGRNRYGAHTDYDGFTLLWRPPTPQGELDGLEIESADGRWVPVPSPPGTLTVNIGDLLATWTNGRWKATRHRVARGVAERRRLSLVYFTGPNPDTVIEPLPSPKCLVEGAPRFARITAAEHIAAKMRAATFECATTAKL